jgi:hypothetical protein
MYRRVRLLKIAVQNSGPNGMAMPSYGLEQNPYAHLHQQHAAHPHLNPYANTCACIIAGDIGVAPSC